MFRALLILLVVAGCAPLAGGDLARLLMAHDLRATDAQGRAVTYQFFQTGRGSALYDGTDLPLVFSWEARGETLCIDGAEARFGPAYCAVVQVTADTATLQDQRTGAVTTATLIPR